ncbi:MAG: polysaccharide deacetylase family protein [Candidatus Latescibacterota bacterium]|nr:MAG: polysaccharide deacetylase family protein [Candidatus Latescibacterota bacterium]
MTGYSNIAREIRNAVSIGVFSAMVFLVGVVLISHPGRPGQVAPDSTDSTSVGTAVEGCRSVVGRSPADEARSLESAAATDRLEHTDETTAPDAIRSGNDVFPPGEKTTGVPVLCYHYLRAETTPLRFVKILGALFLNLPLLEDMDVWTQTASSFDRQMTYLKKHGYESVDLSDLYDWQRGRKKLPSKPVVITFDDGDRSVLEFGYPILERHGFKATLFVVTSRVGQLWGRVDCLGWDDLKMLQQSGVFSIQSHTHDLHRKVSTSKGAIPIFAAASDGLHTPASGTSWTSEVSEDLRTSRKLIKKHVGGDARFLAWPYGFANARLDSVAVGAGFFGLCTLENGRNEWQGLDLESTPSSANLAALGLSRAVRTLVSRPRDDSTQSPPPASRCRWERFEIKRFTITARTSMRGFREMLEE